MNKIIALILFAASPAFAQFNPYGGSSGSSSGGGGSGITALTGDVTASGSGSVAATAVKSSNAAGFSVPTGIFSVGSSTIAVSGGFTNIGGENGLTSPAAILDVEGSSAAASYPDQSSLFGNAPTQNVPLTLWNTNTSSLMSCMDFRNRQSQQSIWEVCNEHEAAFQGDFTFQTRTAGSAASERLRITNAGNLGVGTASPAYMVDDAGALRVTGQAIVASSATFQSTVTFNSPVCVGGSNCGNFTVSSYTFIINGNTATPFKIGTSSLTVDSVGDVTANGFLSVANSSVTANALCLNGGSCVTSVGGFSGGAVSGGTNFASYVTMQGTVTIPSSSGIGNGVSATTFTPAGYTIAISSWQIAGTTAAATSAVNFSTYSYVGNTCNQVGCEIQMHCVFKNGGATVTSPLQEVCVDGACNVAQDVQCFDATASHMVVLDVTYTYFNTGGGLVSWLGYDNVGNGGSAVVTTCASSSGSSNNVFAFDWTAAHTFTCTGSAASGSSVNFMFMKAGKK